jgi:hypothetical protein
MAAFNKEKYGEDYRRRYVEEEIEQSGIRGDAADVLFQACMSASDLESDDDFEQMVMDAIGGYENDYPQREKGDDDGVEYGDPRDYRDGLE